MFNSRYFTGVIILVFTLVYAVLERYEYNQSGSIVTVTDKWLGNIEMCDLNGCIKIYPPERDK